MAKILLVDDQPLVLETLAKAASDRGHVVVTAVNGLKAMDAFHKEKFDLVVTDIIMPEQEGISLIMELRREAPEIKIIAISGGGRTGNVEFLKMAEKLGANETIRKPVRLNDFQAALDRCLGTKA